MTDTGDWSSRSNPTSLRRNDSDDLDPPQMPPPDGSASIEQPEHGREEVHSVLTPAGEIESLGRFYRGLGPRSTKVLLFGTLSFILIVGLLDELR
jgi:hypothetical protein